VIVELNVTLNVTCDNIAEMESNIGLLHNSNSKDHALNTKLWVWETLFNIAREADFIIVFPTLYLGNQGSEKLNLLKARYSK
jgi:hypothetical protein